MILGVYRGEDGDVCGLGGRQGGGGSGLVGDSGGVIPGGIAGPRVSLYPSANSWVETISDNYISL